MYGRCTQDKQFLYHGGCTIYPLPWCVQFVSTTMPAKHQKLHIQRNRGRWIIKFNDDLSKTQKTEFTCPQRRNELQQTKFKPSSRTSLPEECGLKVAKEDGNENYSQDNLCLERTKRDTPKYLKAVVLQSGALFAWFEEAKSKSTSYKSWWSSRRSNVLYWSYTIGKSPYKGIIENQEIRKVGLSETHASGKPRSLHSHWLMESQLMEQVPTRKIKTDMEWWSLRILEGVCTHTHRTQRTNWSFFFCQDGHGVMNVDFFSRQGFFWQMFRVSYTWSSNCSVRPLVYTHSPVARTCFCCTVCLRTSAHLHAYAHTRMAQGSWKRCLSHVCLWCLHLAFSIRMSHLSMLFLHGHFRDHSWLRRHWLRHPHDLAVLSRFNIAGHAPLRTCIAKFGYLAKSDANTQLVQASAQAYFSLGKGQRCRKR